MPGINLLIAEDEDNIRNSITKYIRAHSAIIDRIFTARNGQEAIDIILRSRPHIMLLDIQMPLKNGISVMKEATAAGVCPKTIILSGYDEFEYAQRALRYGAADYLLKPFRSAEILERIEDIARSCLGCEPKQEYDAEHITGNTAVEEALDFMRERYSEDMTLSHVAEHVGISPAYLSTLFTRTSGCGFAEHLNRIRIDRACDYFFDNKMKTYEIAFKVGFNDEKYFSNVFKRIKGVSPSQYRKQLSNQN